MKISEQVKLSNLTTMRLGGAAEYVIEIEEAWEIEKAYEFARERGLKTFILGAGANSIGRDEGFKGVILISRLKGIEIIEEEIEGEPVEAKIRARSGEIWDDLVKFTAERGYSGIEAMSMIPGTVGAAPVQNIGAYGQDIMKVLESVEVYDQKTGEIKVFKKEELGLGYRRSIFNNGETVGRYFIIAITIKLKKTELRPPFYTSLQRYIEEHGESDFSPANIRRMVMAVRTAKLPDPLSMASAGSFFKNVYIKDEEVEEAERKGILVWREDGQNVINSGWLIEQAGLKGELIHGMRVSEKAALILINESAESYADLAKAREEISKRVEEKFGYKLEQEPVEIL